MELLIKKIVNNYIREIYTENLDEDKHRVEKDILWTRSPDVNKTCFAYIRK